MRSPDRIVKRPGSRRNNQASPRRDWRQFVDVALVTVMSQQCLEPVILGTISGEVQAKLCREEHNRNLRVL